MRITQVTVKVFGDTVQLAVVGTGALTYRTLQLSSPPRLVIDLPGAVLDQAVPPILDVDRGAVVRVRVGQFQERPPVTRVAVDLKAAVSFTLATSSPGVLLAKFAGGGGVASTTAPAAMRPAAPAMAPARVAQAPPPPPPPVVPPPAPAAPPAVPGAPAATPGRITLEFRNTELADVLTALSRVCNTNIVTDASVKGQVTVRLVDLTCEESLRFILEANNLGFRRIGRNLIIMAAEKLAPPPEAPEAITYPVGFGKAEDVAKAIRDAIKGILVTFDARSNAMIVVGTVAQHEEVRKVLASLDIQLSQVMVETRVVDVSTSDLRSLGLDWGLTGVPIVQIVGTFPNQIVLGIGTFTINAALDALVTERKARVITAPRIMVVDGNEAQVNLGEEVPIPSIDSAGRLTFTFKPIGVILKILPKVNRDGLVTTKVEPEVSSVTEFLQTASGPVPRLATRKATTTVTVRSGDSIILAGLISAEERKRVLKVPLLGDIPVLGALFRATLTDRRETEVIFVVTPHIIAPQGAPAPAVTPRP
ncbi:MAG: AMIN domain-containing protein [bacterium]|nr:AMIN domain-containing protein [bacterium]